MGTKLAVMASDGSVVHAGTRKHAVSQPHPGWREEDPEQVWWQDVVWLIDSAIQEKRINAQQVMGIGVSGLVTALTPMDASGATVRPAILYSDQRAGAEGIWLSQLLGSKIRLSQILPKLVWMRTHEPDNFARVAMILNPHSYIVYRLTGKYSSDFDTANEFGGVFDPVRLGWDTEKCQSLGFDPDCLPKLYSTTGIVGKVTPEAARCTGLSPGIPVIAGTGDSFASLLTAGVWQAGQTMVYLGTTGTAISCHKPLKDVVDTLHVSQQPEVVTFEAYLSACGQTLEWFYNQCTDRTLSFAELDEATKNIPHGSEGLLFLPHLMGSAQAGRSPEMRGTLVGLEPSHTNLHIYRAILEGVAFEIKSGLSASRHRPDRIAAAGGGSRSSLWLQILADVLELPVEQTCTGNSAVGTAFLTGFALGVFSGFQQIRESTNPVQWIFKPQPPISAHYREIHDIYERLHQDLADSYAALNKIKRDGLA
jgi:xylulokinase